MSKLSKNQDKWRPYIEKQEIKTKYTSIAKHTAIDEVREDNSSYVNKTTLQKKSNTFLLYVKDLAQILIAKGATPLWFDRPQIYL